MATQNTNRTVWHDCMVSDVSAPIMMPVAKRIQVASPTERAIDVNPWMAGFVTGHRCQLAASQ